jgi:drug/metabolite transporter (DMT)-like permease
LINKNASNSLSPNSLGVIMGILASIIWAGNFVIAKGVATNVPPVLLTFLRWFFAWVIIAPFAWKAFKVEKELVLQHKAFMCWISLTGFSLYNVCLYIAGHYTSAINLALIGTTSAPIFAVAIGVIFFKESINVTRILGMIVCFIGVLLLLSKGSLQVLLHFHFSSGDLWSMMGSLLFAVYNNLTKRKPAGISNINFLFVGFGLGVFMLIPFLIGEHFISTQPIHFTTNVIAALAYLSIGCSVIAYLFWNKSILLIGAPRTVLFGNLIPIISTIEAVVLLHEHFLQIHLISGVVVLIGLVIANYKQ